MELRDAILQIEIIRTQMAQTQRLRGLRALPIAASGAMALAAAVAQPWLLPVPAEQLGGYLALWIGLAIVSAAAGLHAVVERCRVTPNKLMRSTAILAAEQFLPCLIAGAAVTAVVAATAPTQAWILPGLWQILFGLGIFAFARLLPRAVFFVAGYYLLTGACVLALGPNALDGIAMGVPFGIGQLAVAAILHWSPEEEFANNLPKPGGELL